MDVIDTGIFVQASIIHWVRFVNASWWDTTSIRVNAFSIPGSMWHLEKEHNPRAIKVFYCCKKLFLISILYILQEHKINGHTKYVLDTHIAPIVINSIAAQWQTHRTSLLIESYIRAGRTSPKQHMYADMYIYIYICVQNIKYDNHLLNSLVFFFSTTVIFRCIRDSIAAN